MLLMRAAMAVTILANLTPYAVGAETVRLSKQRFLDKCKGAWAGQMIGVCYGAPTEFTSNGKPITTPLPPWKPDLVAGAIDQDDCYVEMTFLAAMEKHGLGITFEQAGRAFADSKYELWHANRYGRENVRRGIMPPKSGHPEFNRHADDIDFQIEADLFGILCPGLPQESNRLCDIFGHIMNYGDGVYGGMFVSGMYAAAYFEDSNVQEVLQAGLACIPAESDYHKCASDVIAWHKEHPDDWLAAWNKIERKWQDDVDCLPGQAFNIDAKLNGAYIVMGLLYGNGDMLKTMEIATRCGQDSDCNPSSAAGVLACMKGYAALGDPLTGGIPAIAGKKFSHTDYSFDTLIPTCQQVTEKIILRAGGQVADDAYVIPLQAPEVPQKLEQWIAEDQKKVFVVPIPQFEVNLWDPAWKVVECGPDMEPGFRPEEYGRKNVLVIHPVNKEKPAVLTADLKVPSGGQPKLLIPVASDERGDFLLKVFVNDQLAKEAPIDTKGKWITESIDLTAHAGKTATVRIENHPTGWSYEAAYLGTVEIK